MERSNFYLLSVSIFFASGHYVTVHRDVYDIDGVPTCFEFIDNNGIPDYNATVWQPESRWRRFDNGMENLFLANPEPIRDVSKHCTVSIPSSCLVPDLPVTCAYDSHTDIVTIFQGNRLICFIDAEGDVMLHRLDLSIYAEKFGDEKSF